MNNETLTDYMKKVNIINKEAAEYRDNNKGTMYILPTAQLIVKVEYMELTKEELNTAIFKGIIDKKDYKEIEIIRPVPKSEVTKNDKDKFTLIDKKMKGYAIWNVTNGLNIKESFTTKEEAIELYNEINKGILKYYE